MTVELLISHCFTSSVYQVSLAGEFMSLSKDRSLYWGKYFLLGASKRLQESHMEGHKDARVSSSCTDEPDLGLIDGFGLP